MQFYKYSILPFLICCHFASGQNANCLPATAQTDLDIANVRTRIMNGGDMWWDLINSARYEIPKNSGKHSMFSTGLWFGGIDNLGNLRVAAQTYRQSGNDFWPGPVGDSATCVAFDKLWKINRSDVIDFIGGASATSDMTSYPGTWNGQPLAPYFDANLDGAYNTLDGDYPLFDYLAGSGSNCCNSLHGDQAIWWVINDIGNIHRVSDSPYPLGVEIQCQAFAFASMNQNIANTTFYQYRLINKNTTTNIDSLWLGSFIDVDLGNYMDDYVGCDVPRGMGYAYNGDNFDETVVGYGAYPPAIGFDFVIGPEAPAGDGIDNDRDSCIDCTYILNAAGQIIDTVPDLLLPERTKLSKFLYFINNFDSVNGNPVIAEHYYNYLRGVWKNGNPMLYGGDGGAHGGFTNDPCDFMYPGDSDPNNWGSHGVSELPWDEVSSGFLPGDRRFVASCGPLQLLPGSVLCFSTAVPWACDSAGPLASLEKLKTADDLIQRLADSCFNVSAFTNILEIEKINAKLFPNPANEQVVIDLLGSKTPFTLNIFDVNGRLVFSKKEIQNTTIVDIRSYKPGVYFYQLLSTDGKTAYGKFIKLRGAE